MALEKANTVREAVKLYGDYWRNYLADNIKPAYVRNDVHINPALVDSMRMDAATRFGRIWQKG
jgi:hypothetical protein